MTNEQIICVFCGATHTARVGEGKFYSFSCETYGNVCITSRAILEFDRKPERLELTKQFALQCKSTGKVCSASFHASEEGLRIVAE